jgi:polysaccharide biosynthesis protein PslG
MHPQRMVCRPAPSLASMRHLFWGATRGVVALVLLASTTATVPAALADELVVDDGAGTVQVVGTWATSTNGSGFVGDGYRYRSAGDGSSSLRWPFPGSADGSFEVFARWSSGPNRASNATYVIKSSDGTKSVSVNQRDGGGAWQSLGTFHFAPGADNGVSLSDKADGVVVADAIRFVGTPSGAAATASAPSPAPASAASATSPAPAATPASAAALAADPRYFDQTHFRVDRDAFWDFFQKRGNLRTFGFPVTRDFVFLGCATQLFQRAAMQQCPNQGVGTLNLLDDGLMPYTRFNGSTLPAPDPALIAGAPLPSDPDYASKAIDFVRANAPETVDGEPVKFLTTFQSSVRLEDAFPQGGGDAGLLPLLNLQLWGLPTSKPAYDPNNHEFIYQRFQRGVMHYDRGCQCTLGLLLSDYLKALLTGERLPDDLAAQAAASPLLRSFASGHAPRDTTFGDAFTAQAPLPAAVAAPAPAAPAPAPAATAPAPAANAPAPAALVPPSAPLTVSSPDYGMSVFLWGHSNTTDRDLKLVTDAGFHWQKTLFQWRQIEGNCKGCFDWSEADRVVKASAQAGVKIIARLDFQPTWARKDGANNGPPDNYQDYADFVSAFVTHFGPSSSVGHVQAIEIWNEVNLDREWGDATINQQQAADYVRLLGLSYAAAKAADPNVVVITAGLSPTGVTDGHSADDVTYLQWLFDAGLQGKYDVLGAHGNTQAPEVDAAFGSLPNFPDASFYFRRIEQLRDVMVKNGDAAKRIWLLEFGWTSDSVHPNYKWFAVSEDKKGTNILKAFEYARDHWQPWIGVMTLWTVPDPSWTTDREEYWWAITNNDGTARPAYVDLLNARRSGVLT